MRSWISSPSTATCLLLLAAALPAQADSGGRSNATSPASCVITSYSIHYTKLYDTLDLALEDDAQDEEKENTR